MTAFRGENAASFAAYLAKYYVAKKGYVVGTVPEAAALIDACDAVLTRNDGYALNIVCIVDRETHPDRRFEVPRSHLQLIGEQCLHYTGTFNWTKIPVRIQVIEIGGGQWTPADCDRLNAMKAGGIRSKVQISGWYLEPSTAYLSTNALLFGFGMGAFELRRLMRPPRLPEEELQPPLQAALQPPVMPWATYTLLVILAAVFWAEVRYAIGPLTRPLSPSVMTLVAMGGINGDLVFKSGQWLRILTAPMLHGDAGHLVANAIALYMGGRVLERLIGRAWFTALFALGAIGGSLMSSVLNPPNLISVGASGAIMALLAAAYLCSYRLPLGGERTTLQINLAHMLIPALIPLAGSAQGQQVDFAAHFGGALTGGLVGWGLWRSWPTSQPLPRFRRVAITIASLGMISVTASFVLVALSYHANALATKLIPPDQIPKTVADERAQAKGLVARYPHDPRSHMALSGVHIEAKDYKAAEQELWAGLEESEILKIMFAPELEWQLRATLAQLVAHRGAALEAKAIALPVCVTPKASPMKDALRQIRLCN